MASKILRFGVFSLDPETGELAKRGSPIKLQQQSCQLLVYLLEHSGQVVTREELRAHLWPDTFVDFDLALNTSMRKIRVALGDSAENPRFIETLPKRGYRFIAPVEAALPEILAPALEEVSAPEPGPPTPAQAVTPLARPWLRFSLAAVAGAVILLAIVARSRVPRTQAPSRVESIAVLPFLNSTGDASIDYLTDGLAESLIDSLAEVHSLRVMAPGTTASFKGREMDPRVAGRELKVAAIVQGKVYKRGDALVIDANLVDTETGSEVWRSRYSRQFEDALDLERELSADLIRKLTPAGTEAQAHSARRSTSNKQAYQHYLQGLYQMRQLSSDASDQALKHFEQAIALDPNYALPYVMLAAAWEILDDWVVAPRIAVPKAKAALETALALDASLSEAHTILGTIHFWYDFDQPAAEKEFQRGIELNPNYDDGHDYYGWFLAVQKRFDQSFSEHRRALELSPFDLQHHLTLVQSMYYAHRYAEAYDEIRTTLVQNPNSWWGHELLGWVYEQQGDLPRSVAELKRAVELEPRIAEPLASLGRAYARQGDRVAAEKVLRQLERSATHAYVSPYAFAILYSGLGDRENTIGQIRKAYEARSWSVDFFNLDPKLEPFRADPRVQEIVREAGLP